MARLNVSVNEINLVLDKGRKVHRTGAIFFFLGRGNLPEGPKFERLNGLTVIAKDRVIVTVYRNRNVLPTIRQKAKRDNWKNFRGRGKPAFNRCRYHHTYEFCKCVSDMGLAA